MCTSGERVLRDGAPARWAALLDTGPRRPGAPAWCAALGDRPVPGYGGHAEVPDAVFLGEDLGARGAAPGEGTAVPGGGTDDEERSWAS